MNDKIDKLPGSLVVPELKMELLSPIMKEVVRDLTDSEMCYKYYSLEDRLFSNKLNIDFEVTKNDLFNTVCVGGDPFSEFNFNVGIVSNDNCHTAYLKLFNELTESVVGDDLRNIEDLDIEQESIIKYIALILNMDLSLEECVLIFLNSFSKTNSYCISDRLGIVGISDLELNQNIMDSSFYFNLEKNKEFILKHLYGNSAMNFVLLEPITFLNKDLSVKQFIYKCMEEDKLKHLNISNNMLDDAVALPKL